MLEQVKNLTNQSLKEKIPVISTQCEATQVLKSLDFSLLTTTSS